MIYIKNLKKAFKDFNLEIEDLQVDKGDYVVLLGNSGSGKSVLLEILAGLVTSDSGSIVMEGHDLNKLPIQKRPLGLVFQDQALFPHMTVAENISYSYRYSGLPKTERKRKTQELAEKLEVADLLDRIPESLSGGEKQRVALARTLAREPACLLLDEPLSALDVQLRKEIRAVLRRLNRMGHTVIHVTHDFEEAISVASKIGVVEKGRIIQYGPADEILRNPRSAFVACFPGIKNFFKVELKEDDRDGEIKAWTREQVPVRLTTDKKSGQGFIILPGESIILATEKTVTSAANQFMGEIVDISPGRYGVEVLVRADLPLVAHITQNAVSRLGFKVGQTVWASFKASSIRFIRK